MNREALAAKLEAIGMKKLPAAYIADTILTQEYTAEEIGMMAGRFAEQVEALVNEIRNVAKLVRRNPTAARYSRLVWQGRRGLELYQGHRSHRAGKRWYWTGRPTIEIGDEF